MEAWVDSHEPSRRDQNFRRERARASRDGIVNVMEQAVRMDEVKLAELSRIDIHEVGDEE
jgi:hypothetical protein